MKMDTHQEQLRRPRHGKRAVFRIPELISTYGDRHRRRPSVPRPWVQKMGTALIRRIDGGRIGTLSRSITVVSLFVVGMWVAPEVSRSDNEWQPTSYEQRFETPKNGVRLEDNNVWVYTRTFAERFGMPERWISDDLEGAEAVAYRVEAQNVRYCGYFGEPDNCRTDYLCTFDLYLSDKESRKLPWKTDRAVEFAKEDTSVPFLSAQSRTDQKGWIEEEQRYDRSRLNIGLDSISWVSGRPRNDKVFSEASDGVRVMAYDRELFAGLAYIKLALDCGIATEEHNVRLFFQEKRPMHADFGYRYVGKAIKASPENEQRFRKAKEIWFRKQFLGDVPHTLSLPDNYLARINEYDRKEYEPKSLATEVERRLGRNENVDNHKP